jgi:hypothetical protein
VQNEYTKRQAQPKRRRRWRRTKVDWESFLAKIEGKLQVEKEKEDSILKLKERLNRFNNTLLQAGHAHVGKSRPRTRDCGMNPTIRTALKKRNTLKREVASKRKEWLEAQQLVDEAKLKAWEVYLSEVEFRSDPCDMWRGIRNLMGTPTVWHSTKP